MWKRKLEAVKILWKRKHFEERSWKQKIFHKTWVRDVEAGAVKFLWKRKHFEERSWKRKIFHETWGRDVEAEAGSG